MNEEKCQYCQSTKGFWWHRTADENGIAVSIQVCENCGLTRNDN